MIALHMAVKGQNVEIVQELIKPDLSVLRLEDQKGKHTWKGWVRFRLNSNSLVFFILMLGTNATNVVKIVS